MQLTISRWGNSLAVRIPAKIVRDLALEEGTTVDCTTTPTGAIELVSTGAKTRAEWLKAHFSAVNARLAHQQLTTPATDLLREEERY